MRRSAGSWYERVPRPVLYLIYESPSTAEFDVQKEARIHSYVCCVTQFEINSARERCVAFASKLERGVSRHRPALASALTISREFS